MLVLQCLVGSDLQMHLPIYFKLQRHLAPNCSEAKSALCHWEDQGVVLVQAAQAGCTFSLKRQLLEVQAQATAAALQKRSTEDELRAQLQSATTRAESAELEMKKLGAQEELHGEVVRQLQVRLSIHHVDWTLHERTHCAGAHLSVCLEMLVTIILKVALPRHAATEGCSICSTVKL